MTRAKRAAALGIRLAMNAEGVSQRTLAKRMGVSEPRVSQLLNDDGGNPTLRTLERAAEALGYELSVRLQRKNRGDE